MFYVYLDSRKYKFNHVTILTLYVISLPILVPVTPGPTVAPLSLTCETVVLSDSQQVSISCSSSRDLSTLQFECSLDGESVTEGCELFFLWRISQYMSDRDAK